MDEPTDDGPRIPDELWLIWCVKLGAWATANGCLLAYFSREDALRHLEASGVPAPPAGYSCYPVKVK